MILTCFGLASKFKKMRKFLSILSAILGLGIQSHSAEPATSIYDISVKTIEGKTITLSEYKGKVMLIVNTASKCGFTPQYEGLQKLHESFGNKGLAVLGFPCNQFASQEPGTSEEIVKFCSTNYGVTFQMFDKIDVNGDNAHPLYVYLKKEAPGVLGTEGIKWNFTKFLVTKDGKIYNRYSSNTAPADIQKDIEELLAQ